MGKSLRVIFSFLTLVVLAFGSYQLIMYVQQQQLAPTDTSAIFGGEPEFGYPFAGYMISSKSGGRLNICSVTYLTSDLGVTAAHCVYDTEQIYAGEGQYQPIGRGNQLASRAEANSGWNTRTSNNDIAIVNVATPPTTQIFAQIASPVLGCDYIVVGYGRTETEAAISGVNRPRKSAKICVNRIENDLFYVNGLGGGICSGDSGSAIFERGTNRIVGIVSAITSNIAGKPAVCAVDNTAVAVRIDKYLDYLGRYTSGNISVSNNALCGESCATNPCSDGLTCNANKQCVSPYTYGCFPTTGDYCSDVAGISCVQNNFCSNNKCIAGTISGGPSSSFAVNSVVDTQWIAGIDNNTVLIVGGIGFMTIIALFMLFKVWGGGKKQDGYYTYSNY